MRALWTGSLNFGLINIPVKLYSASEERGGIELDMLHREDLTPIKYVRVCTHEGKEIPLRDIVKGYEYQEGMYVTLEGEDFERANLLATRTIDIHEFTDESSIDPLYYDKPYVLLPGAGGEKSYVLLREALKRTDKVGIVTFVLRGRGRLGFVKAQKGGIVLERLRFKNEIRDPSTFDVPDITAEKNEADIAVALVQLLTQPFRIEDYHDTYTEELQKAIAEKVRGEKPAAEKEQPEPKPTKPDELMKLLRASIDGAKGGRFTRKKQPGKVSKKQAEATTKKR